MNGWFALETEQLEDWTEDNSSLCPESIVNAKYVSSPTPKEHKKVSMKYMS